MDQVAEVMEMVHQVEMGLQMEMDHQVEIALAVLVQVDLTQQDLTQPDLIQQEVDPQTINQVEATIQVPFAIQLLPSLLKIIPDQDQTPHNLDQIAQYAYPTQQPKLIQLLKPTQLQEVEANLTLLIQLMEVEFHSLHVISAVDHSQPSIIQKIYMTAL